MNRWIGRVALVTGASTGIGASICRELVKKGMIVVGCARRKDNIEAIAEEKDMLTYAGKLHPIKCDMSVESDILSMHEEIRSKFGRLDVCVNNAVANINSSLVNGELKDWKYMLEVGILGLCINTRESIKLMAENGEQESQIIHMGSIVAHKFPNYLVPRQYGKIPWNHMYSGIKFMTRALAEGLRQELHFSKSQIRVALISPGPVNTDFSLNAGMTPEIAQAFCIPTRRLEAKDVADAVVYILSTPEHVNVNDIILEPFQVPTTMFTD